MLQHQFIEFVRTHQLFEANHKLLLAFSGGVDSVVLAHLLVNNGYKVSLAHVNFQLREQESDADESFAIAFAESLSIPIYSTKMETKKWAEQHKQGIQEAARALRYNWFKSLMNEEKNGLFQYLLTAHHVNDNAETVFMNFCRGTGIEGLKGILEKDKNIIRPLLFATKEAIIQYAHANALQWREDSSNASTDYTRNFLRHEVFPLLEEKFPGVQQNLHQSIGRYRAVWTIYQQAMQKEIQKLKQVEKGSIKIPVNLLLKSKYLSTLVYELFKPYGFTASQVIALTALIEAPSGKAVYSSSHRVLKNRDWLIISENDTQEQPMFVIESNTELIKGNRFILKMAIKSNVNKLEANANVAFIPHNKVQYPLVLRPWKQGDYFYPLGMQKKKKLSRFFIDQKLSMIEKENVWVLESNKKIMWVVGYRMDNRFKLEGNPPYNDVAKFTYILEE